MKKKVKEKIRLENGIYKVKLFGLNDNITYSKDLRKKYPFSSNSGLYVLHGVDKSFKGSKFFKENELLVKYKKEDDFVTEYKSGVKIPIVYVYSNSLKKRKGKFKVVIPHCRKNMFPSVCIGIIYQKYVMPMVYFNQKKGIFKEFDKIINDQFFVGNKSANLLTLPSDKLDEIIEEYNKIYEEQEIINENIVELVKEDETNIDINEYNEDKKIREEKQSEIKRNYEKYYVDGDTKKKAIKGLLSKKY